MFDLDHMLDGRVSRKHHQDLIRETQQYKLARDAQRSQKKLNALAWLRPIMTAIINLITR